MTRRYKPVMGVQQANKRVITIYLSSDAMLTLNQHAKARGIAVSRMASEIVAEFLEQRPALTDRISSNDPRIADARPKNAD